MLFLNIKLFENPIKSKVEYGKTSFSFYIFFLLIYYYVKGEMIYINLKISYNMQGTKLQSGIKKILFWYPVFL